MKLSFKKESKPKGLFAVIRGEADTKIMADKKYVGRIYYSYSNSFTAGSNTWRISLLEENEEEKCGFKHLLFKIHFNSDKEARGWLKTNWNKIQEKYKIFKIED